MSLLHRSLLAQIMAAIDPIIETTLTVVNPAAGVVSRVVLTDLEQLAAAATANAAATTATVAAIVPPVPAPAPAPTSSPQASTRDMSQAPAPILTAQDVIVGLTAALNDMAARAQPPAAAA